MEKPTAAALATFDSAFPADTVLPGGVKAQRKQMFGMPAGFVNGNMFYGVFADGVVLRLPDERRVELGEHDGIGRFEPTPGRPWKEYVHISAAAWGDELAGWAVEALEHTAKMPAKKPKARKKK